MSVEVQSLAWLPSPGRPQGECVPCRVQLLVAILVHDPLVFPVFISVFMFDGEKDLLLVIVKENMDLCIEQYPHQANKYV